MLKIKDDVDLKELEKFGFKTKYDVDTGELDRYIKYIRYSDDNRCIEIKINAKEYWIDHCDFFRPEKKNPSYRIINIRGDMTEENGKIFIEALYDLIEAGLVEKVEE